MTGTRVDIERHFFATAAKGAEALLVDELRALAADAAGAVRTEQDGAEAEQRDTLRAEHGGGVRAEHGGASFSGPLELGYRACLWSRVAQRVLLRLATVSLEGDPEALWSGLAEIDWTAHLSPDGTLAVDFAGLGAVVGVTNTLFGAQRTKDVIVDQLRARFGRRPSVDPARPDLRVNVYVGRREATVAIDLSGDSLHRRGYRRPGEQVEAPLKETLAAAVLLRAGWPAVAAAGGSVVDPLCGSGTLPIEAALQAADVAPGLLREAAGADGPHWGFLGWRGHDAALWKRLVAQAGERSAAALARLRAARSAPDGKLVPVAYGYDRDARAIALARDAVTRAGLQDLVRIEAHELARLAVPEQLSETVRTGAGAGAGAAIETRASGTLTSAGAAIGAAASGTPIAPGLIVANPPYGRRLGADRRPRAGARPDRKASAGTAAASTADAPPSPYPAPAADPTLVRLYELLGSRLREGFTGWKAAILVNDLELGKCLGLRARRTNRFMNGALPCTLLRIELDARAVAPPPPRAGRIATPSTATGGDAAAAAPQSAAVEQFANRLAKNARRWSRFMRRAGIGCYRVYDADLPDFALAIDVYERWVHVQEYAPPPEIDLAKAAARLAAAMRVVPEVLGAAEGDVFLKVRAQQRGAAQYARRGAGGIEHEVHEGDLAFLVNFTDYLDTGLFLPGREVRRLLARLATGQRFLNLFGYTGTATVAAAKGGAAHTTTVDLNGGYLAWAERNFALNKLKAVRNQVVEADVLRWVAQSDERFGLIYLDPPTFSNSKKMGRATFDVRRDHADLIRLVGRRLLEPGGVLIFACNTRRFAFDVEALTRDHDLEDLSRATLPPDFARSARSHHLWQITPRD